MSDGDTLAGGTGIDVFEFDSDDGNGLVTGFTNGEDVIDLSAFSSITDFSDLTIASSDDGVVIDLTAHGGGTIQLQAIDLDDLDASDFIFTRLDGGGTRLDDTLQADDDGDRVDGGAGDDSIAGGAGWDLLYGAEGNDTVAGGEGQDWIEGGTGNDEIDGDEGADFLGGGAGSDAIRGGTGDDTLAGHGGDDELHGGEGNDVLEGGEGADTLDGGEGDDELYGDGGADVFVFDPGHGRDVVCDFTRGEDRIDLTGFTGITSFDNLSFTPGDGGVTLDLGEFGGGTVFLEGVAFGELDADDFVFGDGWQYGGEGNDGFHIGGDREASTTSGDDSIDGLGGNDQIYGYDGNDHLRGGSGNDWVLGWDGNDTVEGDGGHDQLRGGGGDDTVLGGEGNDHIQGDDVSTYHHQIIGAELGEPGHDALYGGAGNDLIWGQGGNDTLDGGSDDDWMWGGAGDDTFVFSAGHGNDTIYDFTDGEDQIDLSAFSGISGFDDLSIRASESAAVIDLTGHGGGTIRIENIDVDELDAEDFAFRVSGTEPQVDEI